LLDSTPLVCITGQVFAHLLGTDAFQEIDVINTTAPVTKWNYQITCAEEIPEVLAKAFYIATSGRPGPVLLDITKNAQLEWIERFQYTRCQTIKSYKPYPKYDPSALIAAAECINNAKKPLVLLGQGVMLGNAEKEFQEFVEKAGLPFAWTLLGLSAMPTHHPLNMGMLGMHGNYGPNVLTNECDVLIAVGMRFDDRVTGKLDQYAKQATIIHLEIDPSEVNKNVRVAHALIGDCKETLPALTQLIHVQQHGSWVTKFQEHQLIEENKVIKEALYPQGEQLTMGEVIRMLNEILEGEAIVVTDVGQHQMVTSRYIHYKHSRSNITSGGLGTMGFGLPAAIGASLGCPERMVLAVIGDGGFQMTLQELGVLAQEKIPVKVVILNNQYLGMVRQWQQLFHERRYSFVDMQSPDFVTLAKAYDIPGQSVEDRSDLKNAIRAMVQTEGPFLLEVKVAKEENVFPMVPQGCSVSQIRLD
jgi:acetolactate synthase-1/2/3 large subunit